MHITYIYKGRVDQQPTTCGMKEIRLMILRLKATTIILAT